MIAGGEGHRRKGIHVTQHSEIDSAETTPAESGDRRATIRLERRARTVDAYVAGVDRRLSAWAGGTTPEIRSHVSRAARLVDEARSRGSANPAQATRRLDEAMEPAKAVQAALDEATRTTMQRYYAEEPDRSKSLVERIIQAVGWWDRR